MPRLTRRWSAFLCLAIAGVTAMCTDGCRTATQVTLDLSTTPKVNCGALLGVRLTVAGIPKDAEDHANSDFVTATATCASPAAQEIGTLVVTPGSLGRTAVVVVAGVRKDARSCKLSNKYEGCVVARRSLAFRDHVSTTVPIVIDPDCVDVPCDATTTCKKGTCISSELDCTDDGSCESVDPRGRDDDSGAEAGDGSTDDADGASKTDGPGSDADAHDGSTSDVADAGSTTICKASCTVGNGTCPVGPCCWGQLTGGMPSQACVPVQDCTAGGGGRAPNGLAECCRSDSDCGGESCCLIGMEQTVCRTACLGGEAKVCTSMLECVTGMCMGFGPSPYAQLRTCQ